LSGTAQDSFSILIDAKAGQKVTEILRKFQKRERFCNSEGQANKNRPSAFFSWQGAGQFKSCFSRPLVGQIQSICTLQTLHKEALLLLRAKKGEKCDRKKYFSRFLMASLILYLGRI